MNIWPDNKTTEPPLTFAGMPPDDWLKNKKANDYKQMLTAKSDPVKLYQKLCEVVEENAGYLKFKEPPKTTGWDLYITPDFTLSNAKPVNWFNRKMQELILGFKWKRQKA